jgi:hypothetical protein
MLKAINLALVFVFPIAWFAPLIRTGLLPEWQMPEWLGGRTIFTLDEITVISGLQALWEADVFLAIAVTFFALVAPMLKCLGTALIQFGWLSGRAKPAVALMAKLAMADIFILAIWIIIAKGIGVGEIEVAWGMYLFTGAVIAGLLVSVWE